MTTRDIKDKSKSGPWIITITLIAALAVSYYQWNRHTRQSSLYAEVMATYKPPVYQNNQSDSIASNDHQKAIEAFNYSKYDASYTLFKGIKPKTDNVYWYLGHIALINGDVYEAKNHSKKIKDATLKGELLQYVDRIISK